MSTSSHKRQRVIGSFSPESPPYQLANNHERAKPILIPPGTPTSPPYMSSTPQINGVHLPGEKQSSMETTPPSATMSSQSYPPLNTSGTTFPTPASTTGTTYFAAKENDGDTQMQDAHSGLVKGISDDMKMNGNDYMRTDHDRQKDDVGSGQGDGGLGSFYLLCESPLLLSKPHASQNLIDLYGLNAITASVARRDPVTGAKINKLRKSYETKIKEQHLAGRNKPVSNPNEFINLLNMPDEYYDNINAGKNITDGLPSSFLSRLDKALYMTPGKLPPQENEKWKNIIGTDYAPKARPVAPAQQRKPNAVQNSVNASASHGSAVLSTSAKAARPERTGTKRRYIDSSFKGYGEGYADDDQADSTAGEEEGRGRMKKKQRKEFTTSPLGPLNERPSGYLGMIGVRR